MTQSCSLSLSPFRIVKQDSSTSSHFFWTLFSSIRHGLQSTSTTTVVLDLSLLLSFGGQESCRKPRLPSLAPKSILLWRKTHQEQNWCLAGLKDLRRPCLRQCRREPEAVCGSRRDPWGCTAIHHFWRESKPNAASFLSSGGASASALHQPGWGGGTEGRGRGGGLRLRHSQSMSPQLIGSTK